MATQTEAIQILEIRRTFSASRDRVFRAWTQPEELKKWAAPGPMTVPTAEVDFKIGGRYRMVLRGPDGAEHRVSGIYKQIDPPKRLVYSWKWDQPSAVETIVTVEFRDLGAATEVVLRQEGFASSEDRERHEKGWNGCLDKFGFAL
ncbi:MAG TPA: SRPBCC domain-containing protein [Gemmatimonadaceae bacterium]|nr:SRPBCC domain-containing protein [Gemmatimonadaceae bacterium]